MKRIFTAMIATFMLASCIPSTPQARIEQSPQMFHQLSSKHQALVGQGQISRGMPPDAVYLAWGAPSNTLLGSFKGKDSERWDYSVAQPIYTTNFYGGYGGYGYSGHRGYRYSGAGFGFGPQIAYVPSHVASVWFVDHRVDSWERQR